MFRLDHLSHKHLKMFLFKVKWKVWSAVCATKCEAIMFYISKQSHLTHVQIPRNMRSETLQTIIKEAQVCSYLLSASNPRVVHAPVPLWFPSCLCPCEFCWWNLPSPGDGCPASLAAPSVQRHTDLIRRGQLARLRRWFWKVTHKAALFCFLYFPCRPTWPVDVLQFMVKQSDSMNQNLASHATLISEMDRVNIPLAWTLPLSES